MKQIIYLLFLVVCFDSCKNKQETYEVSPSSFDDYKLWQADTVPLPGVKFKAVDLSPNMPPVGYQGNKGACVPFVVAYEVISYYEKMRNGYTYLDPNGKINPNSVYSPAYIYNGVKSQLGSDDCSSGIEYAQAFNYVVQNGCCPWDMFAFNPDGIACDAPPGDALIKKCQIKNYYRFKTISGQADMIKSCLNNNYPVMITMFASKNFDGAGYEFFAKAPAGIFIWNPSSDDISSLHAITIVGYNDSTRTFKLMNSYDKNWGSSGFCYVPYQTLLNRTTELYFMQIVLSETKDMRSSQSAKVHFSEQEHMRIKNILTAAVQRLNLNENRTYAEELTFEKIKGALSSF